MEAVRMKRPLHHVIVLALLAPLAGAGVVAAAEPARSVVAITPAGASQNVLFVMPSVPPKAVVVMFPGGDGVIGVRNDGSILRPDNFLVRTQPEWLAQGFVFVAVDAASQRVGQRGDRVGPENVRAIAKIIAAVRQRTAASIWLLGNSAGAPAAVAGAAALPKGSIAGVVISSPVSVPGSHDTVFDVDLARIAVPVLVQIHSGDTCRYTPPANAARIKAALTTAPVVDVQVFSGGSWPRSGPCEAFGHHGFVGIEDQVVDAAADWIRAHRVR